MNDIGDVRLVNAHAERVGRGHDGAAVADERLLIFFSLVSVQSRVVARGGKARLLQKPADLLDRFARGAVDNAALVPPLGEQLQKRGALVLRAQHFEAKIGPVKAGHDRFRLMQLQNTDDIGAHLRRGRCGKGRDSRAAREPLQKFHDL